jgi:pilus assembly protein CpaB
MDFSMDKNKIRILIIAGVMGLLAAILFYIYIQQEKAKLAASIPVASSMEEVSVVLATKDIPRGQTVEKNVVAFKKIPVNFIQPGALTSIDAALGKMALADILSGEQITSSKLTSSKSLDSLTQTSLAMITPPGKRAITIQIDPLMAVGGMVKPGDYVDVLANFPVPQEIGGRQSTQLVTVTLFQNVLILAVGNQLREIAQASNRVSRAAAEQTAPTQPAQTITLALSPQEAELISYAQEQGKLKLILRPPLDTQTQALPVASGETLWQYILSTQGINLPLEGQAPQKIEEAGTPAPQVEVYRGGKK